jgi:MFS family permease
MTAFDLTIVNVGIPALGRGFRASISSVQWVLTGYMLAFASVIPLTGLARERCGAKRIWLVSLLLFLLGSALAGADGAGDERHRRADAARPLFGPVPGGAVSGACWPANGDGSA